MTSDNFEPLKIAILGAGLMGCWHAHAIQHAGGRIVAVCDPDRAAATALARRLPGKPALATDWDELEGQPINVCHICTPSTTHYKLALEAVEAGKHVMVEKPPAAAQEQTATLLTAAEQRNVLVCPVYQFPFQAGVQSARRRLPALGQVAGFHYTARSAGAQGLPPTAAAALATEILLHPLSLIAALWPEALPGITWQTSSAGTGELLAIGAAGGIPFSISISASGRPPINRAEIVAAAGTIHLDFFHGYAVEEPGRVSRAGKAMQPIDLATRHLVAAGFNLGRRLWQREPAYPGLRSLVRAFYAAIRSGAPPPIPPHAMLDIARAYDQIQATFPEPV